MFYPNQYFQLRHYSSDPDEDSPVGKSRYQYGMGTRPMAVFDFPAAAAFAAVAPFNAFNMTDGTGPFWTFVFRPDIALGTNTVVGRVVSLGILGATAAQVAIAFGQGINLISVLNTAAQGARFGATSFVHNVPLGRVTVCLTTFGVTPAFDFTSMIGVVGFASSAVAGSGQAIGASYAAGWILPVDGASLVDTETFTITAPSLVAVGATVSQIFEFDSGGGITAGRTAVPFTALQNQATIAATIASVLNNTAAPPVGRGALMGMRATAIPTSIPNVSLVSIIATVPGSVGGSLYDANLIEETVANAGFLAWGMVGGQDGSFLSPLRWGLSRGASPISFGFDVEEGEG